MLQVLVFTLFALFISFCLPQLIFNNSLIAVIHCAFFIIHIINYIIVIYSALHYFLSLMLFRTGLRLSYRKLRVLTGLGKAIAVREDLRASIWKYVESGNLNGWSYQKLKGLLCPLSQKWTYYATYDKWCLQRFKYDQNISSSSCLFFFFNPSTCRGVNPLSQEEHTRPLYSVDIAWFCMRLLWMYIAAVLKE